MAYYKSYLVCKARSDGPFIGNMVRIFTIPGAMDTDYVGGKAAY